MTDLIRFPKILVLFLIFTFATFSSVFITPALPLIAQSFGISGTVAQGTMSAFLIGYSFGQLPFGPVANRFGRKKAIALGAILALIGSLLAYSAAQFWVLYLSRMIQAVGTGAGLTITFTMIGDLHRGEAATKAISLLTSAFGIMPGVATAIGGAITEFWGWQECFLFLAFYSLFLWILSLALPETAHELHRDALELKKIGHSLYRQLKDPFIVLHAILTGCTTASIFIFATIAPYIGIHQIGLTPSQFGLWSLIPSFGLFFGGAFISKKLSGKFNPRINMLGGILIVLLAASVLSLCFANSLVTVWSLFIPMFFINIGNNLIWTNASSRALSEAADKSNASAVIQCINLSTATVGVLLVGVVPPTTAMLLPAAMGAILILMGAIWLKLRARH